MSGIPYFLSRPSSSTHFRIASNESIMKKADTGDVDRLFSSAYAFGSHAMVDSRPLPAYPPPAASEADETVTRVPAQQQESAAVEAHRHANRSDCRQHQPGVDSFEQFADGKG